MVILFLSILISNSLAVEISRRSLIQALTAAAAYNAVPKALTTSLTARPIDPKTAAFHRAMWIENEIFNPQALYNFAVRFKIPVGETSYAELQTPYGSYDQIVLSPPRLIELENQLTQKILDLNYRIAIKWKLDATLFTETILHIINPRNGFPFPHERGYKTLPIEAWIEYLNALNELSPEIANELQNYFGMYMYSDTEQGRALYWKNVEFVYRVKSALDEDPLLNEKIEKVVELELAFSKSNNILVENLYEEIATLIDSHRDFPWNENFVPRKFDILDDQIILEFLGQIKSVWPELFFNLNYEYEYIKELEGDWKLRYGDFYARTIHSLTAFERDVEQHQFQIPKDARIWEAYLNGKKAWGFDPAKLVLDQLEISPTNNSNHFAKALAQLFVKTEQKINLAATDGLKQLGEHLLSNPVEEETICVKALTDSSTTEVLIDLNLNHETSKVEVDTNQIAK